MTPRRAAPALRPPARAVRPPEPRSVALHADPRPTVSRAVGNARWGRLLAAGALRRKARSGGEGETEVVHRSCATCSSGGPPCSACEEERKPRAKLRVSRTDDPQEREADAAADRVMRGAAPAAAGSCGGCSAAAPCEDCAGGGVHRHAAGAGGVAAPDGLMDGLGAGRPLDAGTRAFFEPRLGADFGGVRVHTGARAAAAADSVDALAFTVGRDVVFGAGRFAPGTDAGRRLLAHELAHVAQNGAPQVRRQGRTGAPPSTAPPAPGVCGPDVDAQVTGVWTRIRSEFNGGFSTANKRDACLMLVEPIITVRGGRSAHSGLGLNMVNLAAATHDGVLAFDRVLTTVLAGGAPAPADLAALDAAAAAAANAAVAMGDDVAVRIDNLLGLTAAIARLARDMPAVVPPLRRIAGSLASGDAPRTRDLLALAAAAERLAPTAAALVSRFVAAAGVVQTAISRLLAGSGPVVASDVILQALGLKLNRDAFDVIGLYQGSASYTRQGPYYPTCGTPGSLGNAAQPFDAAHENPQRCSNTVKVGTGCWLTGTPNYGTFGIMMRLCSDWTATPGAPADMQRLNFAFSDASTEFFARGYKSLDADNPSAPGDWAMATYRAGSSGPSARVGGGGNRSHCTTTCSVPYNRHNPGGFNYVWEPVRPRSAQNFLP